MTNKNAYAQSGVDVEAGYEVVERIKKHVARTERAGVMGALGGFGGMFDLSQTGVKEPVLISGTDGVGTKLMLAIQYDKHDTIGQDCVAMCVNDIIAAGAEPLYFLDYIATGKNEPAKLEQVVAGVAEGCVQSGAALIGGETAEMPGMYGEDDYDLAGFAVGVAENPGTEYNPLFLYGGAGLGKTHLMHAIGNYYYREQPEAKILYVSCEAFTNELIKAIQEKKTIEFKEKYRRLDMLLIDDVQFLAGKESVQEEFFHTFNDLVNANKQIVICSDRKPNEIATLTDRLVSRMQSGIIADITFPSYETRAAILQKKAEQMGVFIPDDVIALIANSSQSNIREMEGLLKKVEAYSKFTNKEINLELAEEALKDVLESNKPNITVEYIQEIVADYYKTSTSELCSKRRTQPLATYRQLAMYLCRKYLEDSLAVIGGKFGGRDHTTVMHSCDKITAMLESDDKLNQDLFVIDKRIKG